MAAGKLLSPGSLPVPIPSCSPGSLDPHLLVSKDLRTSRPFSSFVALLENAPAWTVFPLGQMMLFLLC